MSGFLHPSRHHGLGRNNYEATLQEALLITHHTCIHNKYTRVPVIANLTSYAWHNTQEFIFTKLSSIIRLQVQQNLGARVQSPKPGLDFKRLLGMYFCSELS